MTDYEDDEKEGFKIGELNDFNFADKHVEWGICNLCCSEIGVQWEGPWHYAAISNLLFKVFSQGQSMQLHH